MLIAKLKDWDLGIRLDSKTNWDSSGSNTWSVLY